MNFLEVVKEKEKWLNYLKRDYQTLIHMAKKIAKDKDYLEGSILSIEAHYTYDGSIISGSNCETIYWKEISREQREKLSEKKEYIGGSVTVNNTDYHLEIVVATST